MPSAAAVDCAVHPCIIVEFGMRLPLTVPRKKLNVIKVRQPGVNRRQLIKSSTIKCLHEKQGFLNRKDLIGFS
jgi:hypothetical protein